MDNKTVKSLFVLLRDKEYFEGFVGAFGTMISFFVFRQIFDLNQNMGIVLGLTFISTWLIRKMGMNIFNHVKQELDLDEYKLKIGEPYDLENSEEPKKKYYIFVISFFLLVGVMATLTAKKVISPLNIVIFLLYVVGYLSLIHFSS
tara:strand:- start:339 stop:776 length:438 start_codon:yes stop_codon:yes gene_type:complete